MSPRRRPSVFSRWTSFLTRPARQTPIRTNAFRPAVHALEDRIVPAFTGGVNVAMGDVNGDGFPDIVAAMATQGNQVKVIDGRTGAATLTFNPYDPAFTGGTCIAVGDVNGDGTDEIITGTGNGGGPNVKVFDGSTGAELASFFPYESTFRGGVIVAAGDVDGDGIDEIFTGTGVGGGPRVQVIDALTLQPRADFFAYEDTFRGGVLVGAGDTDGDGIDEIFTGTGVGGGPRVQVIDALTLQPLANFFAYEDSFRGGVLISSADLDGDHKAEVLTGTGPGGGPVVTAFDAVSLQSQARFLAAAGDFRGGVQVGGSDTNGDNLAEFVTGTGPGAGTVRVFTPDGSKALYTFAPFDGQLPNVAVSVQIGEGQFPALAEFGLTVSQNHSLVGSDQQLIFTSRAMDAAAPSRVQLYQSDANGTQGAFLVDLFDDGDFTHRDIEAGDRIHNNAITVNYATAGDNFYRANVTIGGVVTVYTVAVRAVSRPSDAAILQRLNEVEGMQADLDALLDSGASVEASLDFIENVLQNSPGSVQPGSVHRADEGIYWTTPEGIPAAVLANSDEDELSGLPGGGMAEDAGATANAIGEDCEGRATLISPYNFQPRLGQFDPTNGNSLPAFLNSNHYPNPTVLRNESGTNRTITVNDFKRLGQNDLVVIMTHGMPESRDGVAGPVIASGEILDINNVFDNFDDLMARRLCLLGNRGGATIGMTPSFFTYYSGLMKGDVVVMESCHSLSSTRLSRAFGSLGVDAFAGFTKRTSVIFATNHVVPMVQHLVNGGTYGTIPGNGDISQDANQTQFRVRYRDANGTLDPRCDLLRDVELVVAYSWASSQKDLDTGTLFLGSSVGFRHGGSIYMDWSGDNTSTGGVERVVVDVYGSFLLAEWVGSVTITLRAGWYTPAGGSGSATVYVGLRNTTTGEVRQAFSKTITPGAQSGAATTVVGTAELKVTGDPGDEHAELTLI